MDVGACTKKINDFIDLCAWLTLVIRLGNNSLPFCKITWDNIYYKQGFYDTRERLEINADQENDDNGINDYFAIIHFILSLVILTSQDYHHSFIISIYTHVIIFNTSLTKKKSTS